MITQKTNWNIFDKNHYFDRCLRSTPVERCYDDSDEVMHPKRLKKRDI